MRLETQRPRPAPPPDDDRRPLRVIALLPSAATCGNLLCGFFAVLCCLLSIRSEYWQSTVRFNPRLVELVPSFLAAGVYLIVAAMIFDVLDGRLARIARRTSEFGAQLDSIADIVSFGVAPAMLYVTLLLRLAYPADGDPITSRLHWRIGIACAVVYVTCAAIRLARYNAENVRDEAAQRRFSGLPSPGAAAAFIALLLLHEHFFYSKPWLPWGLDAAYMTRWAIAPCAFALGILMVSRLDYVHVFNVYVRREHPPIHLVWLLLIVVLGLFFPEILLVVGALTYVTSGLVLNVLRRRRERSDTVAAIEKHAN